MQKWKVSRLILRNSTRRKVGWVAVALDTPSSSILHLGAHNSDDPTNMKPPEFHNVSAGSLNRCQISGRDDLEVVVDLGHQPLCDSLLSSEDLNKPERIYPLRIMRSTSLGHSQLDFVVEPEEVFHSGYPYRCGVTREVVRHHTDLAISVISQVNLDSGSFVVDIGSNDGTLLSAFKGAGMKVLGVEPTDVADYAVERNAIPSIKRFFTEDVAREIVDSEGPANLVTATNVFAHVLLWAAF